MPKFLPYKRGETYSYALGAFPAIQLMQARPEAARALLVSPAGLSNEGVQKLLSLARERGLHTEEAPKALGRISGKGNCFCAVAFEPYEDELLPGKHLVLHNIADQGNLGTILRTALGFGYLDAALIRPCADVFDPHVVRASMGALFSMRVRTFDRFEEYETAYPGQECLFFRLKNATPLSDVPLPKGDFTLVFGSEAAGLPEELCGRGRGVVIPHSGQIDSLNLAVAAAIGMYGISGKEEGTWR